MRTAYVIIRFRVEGDIPIFKDAGIYSEPCLTSDHPIGELQITLFEATGDNFRDAIRNVMMMIQLHPNWRWLQSHLPPSPRRKSG
jgi:hypothetical protein